MLLHPLTQGIKVKLMKFYILIILVTMLTGCNEKNNSVQDDMDNIVTMLKNKKLSQVEIDKLNLNKLIDGQTLLMSAVESEHIDAVKLLLSYGADPNIKNSDDASALHLALWSRNPVFIKTLLDFGGDANIYDSKRKESLIFSSISPEKLNHVKFLVEAGADVNVRDAVNQTPLMTAATLAQYDIVYFLLKSGADATLKDNWGYTVQQTLKQDDLMSSSEMNAWKEKVIEIVNRQFSIAANKRN
jgi:ankyrin repeat protein